MKRLFLVLLVLWVGALGLTHSPQAHQALAEASRGGSWSGIMVGLVMLLPFYALYRIVRGFNRWRRDFHRTMQTNGIAGRRGGLPS